MDSNLLLFILLTSNKDWDLDNPLMDFLSSLNIKAAFTKEKINLLRKAMPYLPEKYIGLINHSILYTEEIIKLYELKDSLKDSQEYTRSSIKIQDNRNKINKIIEILQDESLGKYDDNLKIFMDLIMNMENHKIIYELLSTLD